MEGVGDELRNQKKVLDKILGVGEKRYFKFSSNV